MKKYILVYDGVPVKIFGDKAKGVEKMKDFEPPSEISYKGLIAAKQTEIKGLYLYETEEE